MFILHTQNMLTCKPSEGLCPLPESLTHNVCLDSTFLYFTQLSQLLNQHPSLLFMMLLFLIAFNFQFLQCLKRKGQRNYLTCLSKYALLVLEG